MAIVEAKEKLPDLFGAPQASRKTVDALRQSAPDKANDQLAKSKEFAIKMMLAGVKNMDPFDENSNIANEMLTTSNLIAQLDSSMVQVNKMTEMAEAVKNPGFNAAAIQGKEVTYDNSMRYFDGNSPVTFDYELEHQETNAQNININSTVNIKNANGEIVYSHRGSNAKGANTFLWDGCDKDGKKMPSGSYSIEVSAGGTKMVSGQFVSFAVTSRSVLSGVVESVDIENSIATKLHLKDGKIIEKSQVTSIREAFKPSSSVGLDKDLIGKSVELDLTKIQAIDGDFDVYFDNDLGNFSKAKISVLSNNGKLIEEFDHEGEIPAGFGHISFNKTSIPNGDYAVKLSFEDKDGNVKNASKSYTTAIIGINYEKESYITIDSEFIKPHNIISIAGQYQRPEQVRAAEYIGQNVKYKDDQFVFRSDNPFAPEMKVKKPDSENTEIDHGSMRIYDQQGQIIAISEGKPEATEGDEKSVNLKFSWDGTKLDGSKAQNGEVLRTDFTIMHKNTDTNKTYAAETTFNIAGGKVLSSDIANGEIKLNLDGGKVISESDLMIV